MNFDLLNLILAAGGGFFGAAIGGLPAFIFTGFAVLVGQAIALTTGSTDFLGFVAFGPVFGPHISFAGGVAAAAYAARRGTGEVGGKDIVLPLASLARPDVLGVGAAFGVLGYLIQTLISAIPWFGSNTDSVALTVLISGLIVRLAIGKMSLTGNLPQGRGFSRFAPRDDAAWVRWQEDWGVLSVLAFMVGLLAAGTTVTIAQAYPDGASTAPTLFFGISAVSLLFLALGLSFPVTHHMTLIAGVGALNFLPIAGPIGATLIGAVCGLLSGLVGELFARLLHNNGNTHIDPPAAAIWPMTTIVLAISALFPAAAAA